MQAILETIQYESETIQSSNTSICNFSDNHLFLSILHIMDAELRYFSVDLQKHLKRIHSDYILNI